MTDITTNHPKKIEKSIVKLLDQSNEAEKGS